LCALIPNVKVLAGLGNVVVVVMWFTAGLWIPRAAFPDWAQTLTDLTPGGASAELLHTAIAGGDGSWQDVVVCLVWIALSVGIAVRVFRWEGASGIAQDLHCPTEQTRARRRLHLRRRSRSRGRCW